MRKSLLVAVAFMMLCLSAYAGNNPDAKCAVHVQAHNAKMNCTKLPAITAPEVDIVTTYPGSNFDFFPVFYSLTEYKAVEYGVSWPADWTSSCTWSGCEDLVIGGIQWSGDGITQTWFACHPGPLVIPGWGWLYADGPGRVCLVDHPNPQGFLDVLDCAQAFDVLDTCACAGVYGANGDSVPAIEPTTWGGIKSMFK
jgi:hypothetical protein